MQECNRAGGILGILNELKKGGLINGAVKRVDGKTLDEQMKKYDITGAEIDPEADRIYHSAPGRKFSTQMGSQDAQWESLDTDRENGCIRDLEHAYTKDGGLAVLFGNIAQNGCVVKTAGVDPVLWHFEGPEVCFDSQEDASHTKVLRVDQVCRRCFTLPLISRAVISERNVPLLLMVVSLVVHLV